MRQGGELSVSIHVALKYPEAAVVGLVSPRVGSEQMSLLMRTLHRPRQQARQHLPAFVDAPATFRRALVAAYPYYSIPLLWLQILHEVDCLPKTCAWFSPLRSICLSSRNTGDNICYLSLDREPCFAPCTVAARRMRLQSALHSSPSKDASSNFLASLCAHDSHSVAVAVVVEQRATCVCNMFHKAVSDVIGPSIH